MLQQQIASWWVGMPYAAAFFREADRRAPAMSKSEEGRRLEAARMAELRDDKPRIRRRITVES